MDIKEFMQENGGYFFYSKRDETYDIIIQYINDLVNKRRFFKNFGEEKFENFDSWFANINDYNYIKEMFDFYEFYLYRIFRFNKKNLNKCQKNCGKEFGC